MSHVYPDPIQGPNSPVAKSFPYQPMPYCPTAEIPQISLRDYFAAAALSSMDAIRELNILEPGKENSQMAQRAYRIADAMIKAREAK